MIRSYSYLVRVKPENGICCAGFRISKVAVSEFIVTINVSVAQTKHVHLRFVLKETAEVRNK